MQVWRRSHNFPSNPKSSKAIDATKGKSNLKQ